MKYKITKSNILTAIAMCLLILMANTDAQTTRRKKKVNSSAVASPIVPPVNNPNGEYLDGNQIVLNGGVLPVEPTAEEPQTTEENAVTTTNADGEAEARMKELNSRVKKLESNKKNEYDQKQQRLLLNLDILTRAETRAESLRKQLFEMIEKENTVKSRIEQIQYDGRSEVVDRSVALMGSLRPEEMREQRKKSLDAEKRNLESLLTQIENSRRTLETNVEKADSMVERVRSKLDKEIDDALAAEDEDQ